MTAVHVAGRGETPEDEHALARLLALLKPSDVFSGEVWALKIARSRGWPTTQCTRGLLPIEPRCFGAAAGTLIAFPDTPRAMVEAARRRGMAIVDLVHARPLQRRKRGGP